MASSLDWFKPFHTVTSGSFSEGTVKWFEQGQLNVAHNCVDRHAATQPDKVAIRWDADEPHQSKDITYGDLLKQVCQCANTLKSLGVQRGDRIAPSVFLLCRFCRF